MSEIMMALGDYRFAMDTAAYQELKHNQAFRWQAQERLLRRPAMQFVGLGEESMMLSGLIYPHFKGGLKQLEQMREEAEKGQALLLVDGLGFVRGQWIIRQIDEGQSFFSNHGLPLKQSFQMTLVRYGEDS